MTAFIWNAAVNLPMALFPIYFTNDLHGSASLWGISNGVTFLMTVLGQRYWGRLCDTTGQRPVMVWSGLWAALLPLWWAIIPSPEWVVAINVVGGFGWAGFNLAAFNLLLEVTPDNRRPSYVAVFNLGVGIASSVAPILGAWVAEAIGIPAVMVASGVLRLASLLLFSRWGGVPVRWIPLPKSSSTVARWTQRPAGWRPSPRARRSQAP
ncbi:MAG: MFS transporter [Limnochordaceae bacterium]|nr:MFS transporter [Limnochordaceae bacterium]